MLENIVDNPLAPASYIVKPGLGILWCTVQLDWCRAPCALALCGTPVRFADCLSCPLAPTFSAAGRVPAWGSARRHEHHERDRRPYRLSQPSSAAAHPTDSSPLLTFFCSCSHNNVLQAESPKRYGDLDPRKGYRRFTSRARVARPLRLSPTKVRNPARSSLARPGPSRFLQRRPWQEQPPDRRSNAARSPLCRSRRCAARAPRGVQKPGDVKEAKGQSAHGE
jgi:hypothetical protein